MESQEWSEDDWYAKTARYCAAAEHCEAEVREKLRQWNYPHTLEPLLKRLCEEDYINATRYCNAYVHDQVAFHGWGRHKIRMMLRAKQLPENDITSALNNIDFTTYRASLAKLIHQKRALATDKLFRFLLQRGFDYAEIRIATNTHTEN